MPANGTACPPSKCANCKDSCGSRAGSGPGGERTEEDLQAQLEAAMQRARLAEEAYENLKNQNTAANGSLRNDDRELKPLRRCAQGVLASRRSHQ